MWEIIVIKISLKEVLNGLLIQMDNFLNIMNFSVAMIVYFCQQEVSDCFIRCKFLHVINESHLVGAEFF